MTDLKYFLAGSGSKTIVLLHGDSLDHRQWGPQEEFLRKDFQVLTYDMRGFGQSPNPTAPYSHVDDLKALLDELLITKMHLVGSSFGGEQAIDFILTNPEMVSSLTLIDTSLSGFPCTVNWDIGISDGIAAAKRRWLNHEVFAPTKRCPEAYTLLCEMVADYSGSYWMTSDLRKKIEPRAFERISEIHVPTSILVGENDLPYFKDIAKFIYNHLSVETHNYASLQVIKNVGHLGNLEEPGFVNMQILRNIGR